MDDQAQIYKDTSGKWRWRIIARNGRIVEASSQGYVNKSDCIKNLHRSHPGMVYIEVDY